MVIRIIVVLVCVSFLVRGENITNDVFHDNKFLPAAFADFNSDKHTDIIAIRDSKKPGECYVKIHLTHQEHPLIRPDGPSCDCPQDTLNIKSAVPGDFDGDGALDILYLSVNKESLYDVYVAYGDLKNLTCPTEKLFSVRGQPLMMDYNGDMIADIFGENENKTRSFWLFTPTRDPPIEVLMDKKEEHAPLRIPSSHGFVDLDNDLAADLFVTTDKHFEIWMNSRVGFALSETLDIPNWAKVVGQTTFMDIGLSGRSDIVTVFCGLDDCSDGKMYVWDRVARTFASVGFPLVDSDGNQWSFPTAGARQYLYTDTITLRAGDYDQDGYPDLLVTLMDGDNIPQVVLVRNVACAGDAECYHGRRMQPDFKLLSAYKHSVLGTFFDIHEDGRPDLLLVRGPDWRVEAVADSQQYDAMFLKVLVPTGRCYTCPHHSLPYGSSPAGATYRYSITTEDRSLQVSAATQLSQSAHMVLQLPYTIFGLGRNWNFVETLEVGLPLKVGGPSFPSSRNFTQIVPNSQLIVIPNPLARPSAWVSKLYITPSATLTLTAVALLAVCAVVGVLVLALHYREMQEDRREKLQQAHTFHFDAM